jgi:hypothetical protein
MKLPKMTWGIDPGSAICGVVCLLDRQIHLAFETTPDRVFEDIIEKSGANSFDIVIEDIRGFAGKMSNNVIDTCKLIGELNYRFRAHPSTRQIHYIPRSTVKKWFFDNYFTLLEKQVGANMTAINAQKQRLGKKGLITNAGVMRLPSFNYVNDRAIVAALRQIEGIPAGKKNIYGLRDHSWQALAVAKAYLEIFGN